MTMKHDYEYVKKYIENRNYFLISDTYKNNRTKLTLKDSCGYLYYISFDNFQSNRNPEKFHKSNPYTIQNIKLWCKLNNKPFELVSKEYKGNNKKLKWKCLKENCGEIFEATLSNVYSNNSGCPFCVGRKVNILNCLATKNPELAKEWHPIKNEDLTPYDVTANTNKKVWWQCSKNLKHEWKASINNRSNGNGCPYCAGFLPSEDYNLLVYNPEICEEWNYMKNKKKPEEYLPSSHEKVWWKCKKCDCEWKASINNRKKGRGCPQCNESKGEKKIREYLDSIGFIGVSQDKFDDLLDIDKYNYNYYIPQKEFEGLVGLRNGILSYDFYLPKHNLLIEYQGQMHERFVKGIHKSEKDFKIQLEHDKRKREYAQKHNIKLLEIWYWNYDNIEKILEKELNV